MDFSVFWSILFINLIVPFPRMYFTLQLSLRLPCNCFTTVYLLRFCNLEEKRRKVCYNVLKMRPDSCKNC
ncbi:hypothetical protein HMPREF1548_05685 [Clostridium sp. KLE 1755]|nr:hypothetical protein HMPREF1548_05685 [Clostridium sp. KLE 1755]